MMSLQPDALYHLLSDYFGTQHWWPVDTSYHQQQGTDPRFEIMIGAILTQNTAWTNVEKALQNLKKCHALSVQGIHTLQEEHLKILIQPSGFFNQKAQRVKSLAGFLSTNYQGNLNNFFSQELRKIRIELLALTGVGPETADSILLYAGQKPVFVVDAYTKRLCTRLPIPVGSKEYDTVQQYFEQQLPNTNKIFIYQQLHALIVECAKVFCRTKPQCKRCPLKENCSFALL